MVFTDLNQHGKALGFAGGYLLRISLEYPYVRHIGMEQLNSKIVNWHIFTSYH